MNDKFIKSFTFFSYFSYTIKYLRYDFTHIQRNLKSRYFYHVHTPIHTHTLHISMLVFVLMMRFKFQNQVSYTMSDEEKKIIFSHNHQITCHATHRWFHNITFSLFIFTFPLQSNFHMMTCMCSIIIHRFQFFFFFD